MGTVNQNNKTDDRQERFDVQKPKKLSLKSIE